MKCGCNPATSERQRHFMCAELGRKRAGKKTQTGMTESQLKDFCMTRKKNPLIRKGIYYFPTFEMARDFARKFGYPANRIIAYEYGWAIQLKTSGPYVGPKTMKKNPVKVMSNRQALALMKKVVAYGKRLLVHERGELRRKNPPIQGKQVSAFIRAIKSTEKYVVGSKPYIEALAKAYEHLKTIDERR